MIESVPKKFCKVNPSLLEDQIDFSLAYQLFHWSEGRPLYTEGFGELWPSMVLDKCLPTISGPVQGHKDRAKESMPLYLPEKAMPSVPPTTTEMYFICTLNACDRPDIPS